MTTDPKGADIARYDLDLMESRMVKDQWGGEWVRYSDHAAELAEVTEARMKYEAERDAALAREAALLASSQANRDLLYQLTGAQSEVTHMRNRFDTAIAGAYEVIRNKMRALHQRLLNAAEAGDESPEFLGTVASGVSMALEAVHDLTPAGALAARDRRDAQMRAEGRKEGLLEAAYICWNKRDLLADAEKKQVDVGLTGRDYYGRRLEAELLSRSIRALAVAEKEAGNG